MLNTLVSRIRYLPLVLVLALAGCGERAPDSTEVSGTGSSGSSGGGTSASAGGSCSTCAGDCSAGGCAGSAALGGTTSGTSNGSAGGGASGSNACGADPNAFDFYAQGSCTKFNSWGGIKAVDDPASGDLQVSAASQGANGQGFYWVVDSTDETVTMDASAYESVEFRIETDTDVEFYLFSGAPVGSDEWTEFAWPVPSFLANGSGEFDVYFLPRGTSRTVSISLPKSMTRVVRSRLRQVQFRMLSPGTVKIANVRLTKTDTPLPALAGNKFDPGAGNTYLVIGQEAAGIDQYWASGMPKPAGLMFYLSANDGAWGWNYWDSGKGEYDAERYWLTEYEAYEGTMAQVGLWLRGDQSGSGCQAIVDSKGSWDTQSKYESGRYLFLLESRLKLARRPVFLRIGYEFDNPEHSCGTSAQYQEAYRTIVDFLTSKGVNNVAYVWHPYTQTAGNIAAYYPGADYVDWIGVSDFTQPDQQAGYLSNNVKTVIEYAKSQGKPVAVAESSPWNISSVDLDVMNNWFGNLFDLIEGQTVNGYSASGQIRMLSYINSNWPSFGWSSPPWSNTLLGAADVQSAFTSNLQNPFNGHRYLTRGNLVFDPQDPGVLSFQ